MLIAICNNTQQFIKTIKKYKNDFIKNKYLSEEEMKVNFNDKAIIKKRFVKLCDLAVGKIV